MLTRFFRQDRITVYLLLPVLVLLLWPGAGTAGGSPYTAGLQALRQGPEGMPLYSPLRKVMEISPWMSLAFSLALLTGLAHGLTRMANDSELFGRRTHLPVLLLPLFLALLPFGLVPDPAFIGMWAVVLAMGRTWTAVGHKGILSAVFDAGMLLGIASALYLPYAFLIVVIWASLAVTRPLSWREYVLPAIGLAAVLLLCWGAVHFIDPQAWKPAASMHYAGDAPAPKPAHWMYGVVLIAVLAILSISTILSFAKVYTHSVMREKNIRASLLAFTFALGLLALFAWLLDHRIPPVLLATPAALLLTYPLLPVRRSLWDEAASWSLLLLACWARWAG
ncbi:MAG: hypothetical protein JST45_05080 [Bacteroidetes bacterium]|nr:hypothetical protein [Bacteroidota bacterium]